MARPKSDKVSVWPEGGRWRVGYRVDNPQTGKREREFESFATEAEARARQVKIEAHLTKLATRRPAPATVIATEGVTVRAHIREWLDTIVARKKQATADGYETVLRLHLLDRPIGPAGELGGDLPLEAFGAREVARMVAGMDARGLSWGYQKNAILVASAAMKWARKWDRITQNPCAGLVRDLKPSNAREPEPNPFTYGEMEAFLTFLQTGTVPEAYVPRHEEGADRAVEEARPRRRRRYDPTRYAVWYPVFVVLFHTGLRRGEAIALKWTEVFLEAPRPYVKVAATFSRAARAAAQRGNRKQPIDGLVLPKTKAALRKVYLSPDAVAVLRDLARTRHARALRERRPASPYVFVGPVSGTRLEPTTMNKVFAALIRAIGLATWRPRFTIHDTRHTFATVHLGKLRSPLGWVSAMLGHTKKSTTLDIYSRWMPEDDPVDYAGALTRTPAAEAGEEAKAEAGARVVSIGAILAPAGGVLAPKQRRSRR
jgi:integrase